MSLPTKRFFKVKIPNDNDDYEIIPERLKDGQFSASLPTLTHDVTLLTSDNEPGFITQDINVNEVIHEFAVSSSKDFISTADNWDYLSSATSQRMRGMAYGNGYWVSTGSTSAVIYSTDGGNTWQNGMAPIANDTLVCLAYGNGYFLCVANAARKVFKANTPLGPWEELTTLNANLESLRYVNNIFVATGENGLIAFSEQGKLWRTANTGVTVSIFDITYGNGQYVAAGGSGTILYSINGETWYTATSGLSTDIRTVTYGNGYYVCGGKSISYSTDGRTWQAATIPTQVTGWVRQFAYIEKRFICALYQSDGKGYIWEARVQPTSFTLKYTAAGRLWNIACGEGVVCSSGDSGKVAQLKLNITWTKDIPDTDQYVWERITVVQNNGDKCSSDAFLHGDNKSCLIKITWAELVELRNRGALTPGQQYQITDYYTTTTQSYTQSAMHNFDIIVVADTTTTLNENARATLHTESGGGGDSRPRGIWPSNKHLSDIVEGYKYSDGPSMYNEPHEENARLTPEALADVSYITTKPDKYGIMQPCIVQLAHDDPDDLSLADYYLYNGKFTYHTWRNNNFIQICYRRSGNYGPYIPDLEYQKDEVLHIDYNEFGCPRLYKTDIDRYDCIDVGYYLYAHDEVVDGVTYNVWIRTDDDNDFQPDSDYEIFTNQVVVNNHFVITPEEYNNQRTLTTGQYDKWQQCYERTIANNRVVQVLYTGCKDQQLNYVELRYKPNKCIVDVSINTTDATLPYGILLWDEDILDDTYPMTPTSKDNCFLYAGDAVLDGTIVNKWQKYDNYYNNTTGTHTYTATTIYIYTNPIVVNGQLTVTHSEVRAGYYTETQLVPTGYYRLTNPLVIDLDPNLDNNNATIDTYFYNSRLNAWQLKYCLDNDTDRFAWASSNGHGVIYQMIDEFNNQAAYDFKNIQFAAFKLTTNAASSSKEYQILHKVSGYGRYVGDPESANLPAHLSLDTSVMDWCYTFSKELYISDTRTIIDASLNEGWEGTDPGRYVSRRNCYNNYIAGYTGTRVNDGIVQPIQLLNYVVFMNPEPADEHSGLELSSIKAGQSCYSLYTYNCDNLNIGPECHDIVAIDIYDTNIGARSEIIYASAMARADIGVHNHSLLIDYTWFSTDPWFSNKTIVSEDGCGNEYTRFHNSTGDVYL